MKKDNHSFFNTLLPLGLNSQEVFIIAEIGKNFIQTEEEKSVAEHLQNAKVLVDEAVNAGADAVKFQTHEVEDEQLNIDIVSPHFKVSNRYNWVVRNTRATPLNEFWRPLKEYCDEKGIIFFSTPMSRKAAQKLEILDVPFWKIGSGDVQDYAMLDVIIKSGKPIIISTGMVGHKELGEVIQYIRGKGLPLAVLYCISQYPAPAHHFNLSSIEYLKEKYPDVTVGFSDHSLGDEITLAAVKVGAQIIEKHFSLSRDLWGSDHKVSMMPNEFKKMVASIKSGEYKQIDTTPWYGFKDKELEGSNNRFRPYFNKALVVSEALPKGTILSGDLVFAMRPLKHALGLPADKFYDVIGKRIKKDVNRHDPITEDILE